MIDLKDVQSKHFYICNINHLGYNLDHICHIIGRRKLVIQCTRIDRWPNYITYHFKHYSLPEILIYSKEYVEKYNKTYMEDEYDLEIVEEVIDNKMKDTTIEFLDNSSYIKLVNKGFYKKYLINTGLYVYNR